MLVGERKEVPGTADAAAHVAAQSVGSSLERKPDLDGVQPFGCPERLYGCERQ